VSRLKARSSARSARSRLQALLRCRWFCRGRGRLRLRFHSVAKWRRHVARRRAGEPGLNYSLNHEDGSLIITRSGPAGDESVTAAHLGQDGVFRDETGAPIARAAGSSVVIDPDAVSAAAAAKKSKRVTRAQMSAPRRKRKPSGRSQNFVPSRCRIHRMAHQKRRLNMRGYS